MCLWNNTTVEIYVKEVSVSTVNVHGFKSSHFFPPKGLGGRSEVTYRIEVPGIKVNLGESTPLACGLQDYLSLRSTFFCLILLFWTPQAGE